MTTDSPSGDGSFMSAVDGPVPGARVAGYEVVDRIGRGGMAVVFRARDERLGRYVALKVLAPALAEDEEFRRRFAREYRLAAAVDDPHIIPVYEAGEADGVLFIAMRYVAGGDVRSLLRRSGHLPPLRAASIVSPVASALDAAHAEGLVHRDVKPANMLLDTRPGRPDHVYLSDFGLSKEALSSPGLTSSGVFLGTPDYISPEQVTGRGSDGRADQYSLACTAFELLTGTPPFPRDNGMAVLYAHASESPPLLSVGKPGLPAAADAVITRAMAKDPADRYPTCREFAESLRAALGLPGYETHPGTGDDPADGTRSPTAVGQTPAAALSPWRADTVSLTSRPRAQRPEDSPPLSPGQVTGPPPGPGDGSRRSAGNAGHGGLAARTARSARWRPPRWAVGIAAAVLVAGAGAAAVPLLTAHAAHSASAPSSPTLVSSQSALPHTSPAPQPAGSSPARTTSSQTPRITVTATTSGGLPSPRNTATTPVPHQTTSAPPPGPAASYASAVIADHPLAYWQFSGKADAGGYADSSGNGNSLPVGATTPASPGALRAPGAISPAAGGTSTTGSLSSFTGDSPRAVETWFQTTSEGCIFNSGTFTHAAAFSLCVQDGPVNAPAPGVPGIYFATYDGDVFIPMANAMDGNWHYLALSLTGNSVTIVYDGAQPTGYIWNGNPSTTGGGAYGGLASQPFTVPYTPNTVATPLGIGTRRPPPHLPGALAGDLAEVAIYPSALPASDLANHYRLLTS